MAVPNLRLAFLAAAGLLPLASDAQIDTTAGLPANWVHDDAYVLAAMGQATTPGFGTTGYTSTFGQTFTAPTGAGALTDFTFWLQSVGTPPSIFKGYIVAWDGTGSVAGPVAWESSSPVTVAGTNSNSPYVPDLKPVSFHIAGGLVLNPGTQYVAFLSSLGLEDQDEDTANLGFIRHDQYSGGGMVFSNATSWSQLANHGWENYAAWNPASDFLGNGSFDLAFRADFAAVPEPATYSLLGALSLAGLAVWRRRGAKARGTAA